MQTHSHLLTLTSLDLLPQSVTIHKEMEYGIARFNDELRMVILSESGNSALSSFKGESSAIEQKTLLVAPRNSHNATALRGQLSWLQPRTLGLHTSVGMGDRLGLATPGHIHAVRATGSKIAPIFAQQSIREMARTGRSPQQVMDDVTWGVFQENWERGFGADADHLKTTEDIDACLSAGYTFFTIDPGAFVDNRAEFADPGVLREMVDKLPPELQINSTGLLNKTIKIENLVLIFAEPTLLKAMAKYGNAIWHVAAMYHHLKKVSGNRPFEFEVSVDETEQPTSHAEHAYISSELKRLGVEWVSLAPRFIGSFEKGVDYIGDVKAFETDIAGHAAIARLFGPYKLSLHSGSDKFSVYPPAMRQTHGLVHLKTAGTSYLEALRTIASLDVDLFREIYSFAREHYETDKVSYHVSAQLSRAPKPDAVENWTEILNQFDAREILHVTFGSVLKEKLSDGKMRFYDRLIGMLNTHPDDYAENLERHFIWHLTPFVTQ